MNKAPKLYRVATECDNFFYITSDGRPRWRDEEYSTTFNSYAEALHTIECCGYRLDKDNLRIVEREYGA